MEKVAKKREIMAAPACFAWLDSSRLCQGLFFGSLAFCYWLGTNPALHYQLKAQTFYLHPIFLGQHLDRPGGMLDWCAGLITQGCVWPAWGAILFAALIGGLAAGLRRLLSLASGQRIKTLHLATALTIGALFAVYQLPAVEVALAALLTVWLALLLWAVFKDRWGGRLFGLVLLCGPLYWFVAEKLILFAIVCASLETFGAGKQRFWAIPGPVVLAGFVLWLDWRFNPANPFWTTDKTIWPSHPIFAAAVLGSLPLAAMILHRMKAAAQLPAHTERNAHSSGGFARIASVLQSSAFLAIAFPVLTVLAVNATANSQQRILLELDYRARQQQWPKVVKLAARLKSQSGSTELFSAAIDTTRALYHLGRLPEALFAVAQNRGATLLPNTSDGFDWSIPMSELMLELGQVNYAEHWAHEALETKGDRPGLLKCLALVNLAKDQPEAARVFLGLLKTHLLCGRWAAEWLRRLDEEVGWRESPELQAIRLAMPKMDLPSTYLPTEVLLKQLLAANPKNRMAHEFLMSHYLLTCQPAPFLREIARLDALGYADIPRHYEEALLIYQPGESPKVDLHGRSIHAATQERFRQFVNLYQPLKNDRERARAELKQAFGDTYWYYLVCHGSAAGPAQPPPTAY